MSSYFISVGEPSGDLLGAELVAAPQEQRPNLHCFGIAGPQLRKQEVEELAGIEELSVMGFVEVIKHITYLKKLEDRLLMEIDRRRPDFAILVDYPGFNMRLAEFLKVRNIPVIQFVAPQLWAWGEGRTKRLREVTDLVMGIMPFEREFFKERDVNFTYVGTPQVDRAKKAQSRPSSFLFEDGKPCVGFFPGSRNSELAKMLPLALKVREQLRQDYGDKVQFAISVAPSITLEKVLAIVSEDEGAQLSPLDSDLVVRVGDTSFVRGESLDLMASVSSALVTSGTATLECALTACPLCVTYKMNPLSFQIAKRVIRLPYVSLVNLVADRELIKEFIQEFTLAEVAKELAELALPGEKRSHSLKGLSELHDLVQGDLANRAAQTVLNFIDERRVAIQNSNR